MEINGVQNTAVVSSVNQTEQPKNEKVNLVNKIKDVIQINSKLQNEILMGTSGYIKMGHLSDEEVAQINKTRELPDKYSLVFKPKLITHHFQDNMYMGDSVTPAHYELIRKELECFYDKKNILNKLPENCDVINDEKNTYIKNKEVTIEEIHKKNKFRKFAFVGLLVTTAAAFLFPVLKKK